MSRLQPLLFMLSVEWTHFISSKLKAYLAAVCSPTAALVLNLKSNSGHFCYKLQLLMSSMHRHTSHHKRTQPPPPLLFNSKKAASIWQMTSACPTRGTGSKKKRSRRRRRRGRPDKETTSCPSWAPLPQRRAGMQEPRYKLLPDKSNYFLQNIVCFVRPTLGGGGRGWGGGVGSKEVVKNMANGQSFY